jgi:hypothetical protein
MGLSQSEGTPGPTVEVVKADERHAGLLAAFYRQVWDASATGEAVRRARAAEAAHNPVTPGEEPPTYIFLAGDRVLGYVGSIPVRVWCSGAAKPIHWIKGLMVLPEHRNGPVGFAVLKAAVNDLGGGLALVGEEVPRRLFQALGFTDLGALPNFLRVLRPARVLRQLDLEAVGLTGVPSWIRSTLRLAQRRVLVGITGATVAGVARVWTGVAGGRRLPHWVGGLGELDDERLEALWRRVRAGLAAAPGRDAGCLKRRYEAGDGRYVAAAAMAEGGLGGLAIVRRPRDMGDPRLRGIRIATIAELLYPIDRPDLGLATLAAAEKAARGSAADALLCSASHGSVAAILRRRGFIRLPGNLHFLVKDVPGEPALPLELEDWWLTRGDSRADQTF